MTIEYCCYGMYADVGHTDYCPTLRATPRSVVTAAMIESLDESIMNWTGASPGGAELAKWIAAALAVAPTTARSTFQSRVEPWLLACFGETIANDIAERNHRFAEESLELVQSLGCTRDEAHQLVDYVFGRPPGEPKQEVGGTMVTLAALCRANGIDMHQAGEVELARIWTKVDVIREKQKRKPAMGPLPGIYPERSQVIE